MNTAESIAYLDSLQGSGIRPGRERVRALLRAAGRPEKRYRSIIVAGTNGKGSTSATLASILQVSGYRSGLYTSPHLVELRERWRIDAELLPEELFVESVARVRDVSSRARIVPTYFEALTLIAFFAFEAAGCDVAVLEVGMGGRLDATNVVLPVASVITSISRDHAEFLGSTTAAISNEKAGIIHRGAIAVTSNHEPAIVGVLERRASKFGVALHRIDQECRASEVVLTDHSSCFRLRTPAGSYRLESALAGAHQLENISLAVRAAELVQPLFPSIDRKRIERGVEATRWRGRLERFEIGGKRIWVDGAHNPGGARRLGEFVVSKVGTPRTLVFGVLQEKEAEAMASALFPLFDRLILTEPESERALPAESLRRIAEESGRKATVLADPESALREAMSGDSESIVVAGSLYLAGSSIAFLDRIAASAAARSSASDSDQQSAMP